MNQTPKWIKLNDRYIDISFIYEVKLVHIPSFNDFDKHIPRVIITFPNSEIQLKPSNYHNWIKENNLNLPTFEEIKYE